MSASLWDTLISHPVSERGCVRAHVRIHARCAEKVSYKKSDMSSSGFQLAVIGVLSEKLRDNPIQSQSERPRSRR